MAAGYTYNPIASQTLGGITSSITFSSIPSTYTDLKLILNGRVTSNALALAVTFNGDTATNYSWITLKGDGTTLTSVGTQSTASINNGAIVGSSQPHFMQLDVFNYANTTIYKTAINQLASENNVQTGYISTTIGTWRNTAAITSITITTSSFDNATPPTMATLYGIQAA